MPRIVPRLLRALQNTPLVPSLRAKSIERPIWRIKKGSLWKGPVPIYDWVGRDRTRSVLADDTNLYTNRRKFRLHKTFPPRVTIGQREQPRSDCYDKVRPMTDQEREWYSSPYLRMLSAPMRMCLLTGQLLPRDFLIRMAPMHVSGPRGSRPQEYFLPTGIEHPRYRSHQVTRGAYIVCREDAVKRLSGQPGSYKRYGRNLTLHNRLADQIGHLLRLRVIQEIEVLAARLKCTPEGAHERSILRKLTRAEFKHIQDSGVIPYPSAVALLIVPPLNKDPINKVRPTPNNTGLPDPQKINPMPDKSSLPLSRLHSTSTDAQNAPYTVLRLIPPQLPLYNGITLFPSRAQRAALRSALDRLLSVERMARHKLQCRASEGDKAAVSVRVVGKRARGDQKTSHAYLLTSDAGTLLRADAVPLAIALWRVRMWEGSSWGDAAQNLNGWKVHVSTDVKSS